MAQKPMRRRSWDGCGWPDGPRLRRKPCRNNVPKRKKRRVLKSNWFCHYCGVSLDATTASVDHKIPLSKGGTNAYANLVAACKRCNHKKASMSYESFIKRNRTLKVWMQIPDTEGSGYHRAICPVKHCWQTLLSKGIHLTASTTLDSVDYDYFIFHRNPSRQLPLLQQLVQKGKRIVWELDDDYWHVPEWNPAHKYQDADTLEWMRDHAYRIITSTKPLANVVNCLDKTTVLPNLADLDLWPLTTRTPNEPLRILWAGSIHHERDLDEVVPAIHDLIDEYQERLIFLFWGDLPNAFAERVRIEHTHLHMMLPAQKYYGRIGLIQSVPMDQYPQTAQTIQADIGLAPLCNHEFNRSKSNVKYLDYSMLSCPMVATNSEPYQDTQAIKVSDPADWFGAIKTLIDDPEKRQELGQKCREDVEKHYSWQNGKQTWLDFFEGLLD